MPRTSRGEWTAGWALGLHCGCSLPNDAGDLRGAQCALFAAPRTTGVPNIVSERTHHSTFTLSRPATFVPFPIRLSIIAFSLTASVITPPEHRPTHLDRRVVDVAEAGDAQSEATHGYAGHDAIAGVANGKSFRQARGFIQYALTTFDDTEVTVACTFVGSDNTSLDYDVVVDDSLIVTRTFTSPSAVPVVVEIAVPFSLTKGKTNVAVMIRARGGVTPALTQLRIIQDHNEVNYAGQSHALFVIPSPGSQNPFGVAR